MATSVKTGATGQIDSTATFRAYHKDISDTIKAAGASITNDTGQIDFSTVTMPSSGTVGGYEIFKLDTDTQQANLGMYIKLEYGKGDFSGPSFAISAGTGTDGAGNLTGAVSTRQFFKSSSSGSTGTLRATTGDGRFCVVPHLWQAGRSNANGNWLFIVERLRDATGNPTDDGFIVFLMGGNNPSFVQYYEVVTPDNNISLGGGSLFGTWLQNVSGTVGADTYLSSIFPIVKHRAYGAMTSAQLYYHTDITSDTPIAISRYGTERTYLPLGRVHTSNTFGQSHSNAGIAIQWE